VPVGGYAVLDALRSLMGVPFDPAAGEAPDRSPRRVTFTPAC